MIKISGFQIGGANNIGGWTKGQPNIAGGWDIKLKISNNYDKAIKYIHFHFAMYNSVGDRVCCTIRGENMRIGTYTGPLDPGYSANCHWEAMFYYKAQMCMKIEKAEIEFMDGTKDEIDGSDMDISVKEGGCYVATCVYGSYDCPQVWTLRRYRDDVLASTWYGRAFIHTYYAISPTVVRMFGNTGWFKKFWKNKLDKMVSELQAEGFEDTPYSDKKW